MSSEVVSISPGKDMREFFQFLYGDQDGYVYSPTKDSNGKWEKHFFHYPDQLNELIKHNIVRSSTDDVYIGPALYAIATGRKEDIKGTYVFWTEFDGTVPPVEALGDLPAPSWRVRSSEDGHEHFYWRLDYFEVDIEAIERANRGLTYQLGGDTSAWDANQVLRAVSTYNHKRGKPVLTLSKSDAKVGPGLFASIPVPATVVGDVDVENIPDVLDVIATYKFDKEMFAFFRKTDIPVGSRSAAMMRLGFYCAEMNLTDAEAYSLLFNADERWGKFKGRQDRKRRLLDIINKARLKFPAIESSETKFPVFAYSDFLAADIRVEWFIEGLLQRNGFLLLVGPPGTGKTQLSLQFAIHLALGRSFLGYTAGNPCRVMFFSMEMGHADLKYFVEQMDVELTDEDRITLQQNLIFIPTGTGVMLDNASQQREVESLVAKYKPDGVFFDSLGLASTDDLSNESTVKTIMDWNARFRVNFDCFTWYIHHNRKAQGTNKKPNKLEDVYGSLYITSNASTVLGLWPVADQIEITGLKIRLAPAIAPFNIMRTKGLSFKHADISFKPVVEADVSAPTKLGKGLLDGI